jgi:natural product precursor
MKKISLKNVKETLSRKEMRVIAGGYGGVTPGCGETCSSDSFCSTNSSCPCCTGGVCSRN